METSILIMIVMAIGLIYLIFKFIKKMIFAVISAILVVVLLFGGVIGIAVYDVKTLSEKTDFQVNIVYFNQDDYILGTTMTVENSEPQIDKIKSLSESDFNQIDLKKLDKNGDTFAITFNRDVIENIITSKTTTLNFLAEIELPENSVIEFTNEELLTLIESNSATDDFIDLLLEKNNIDQSIAGFLKDELKSSIQTVTKSLGISFNEALFFDFLMTNLESNQVDYLEVLSLYKQEEIMIYPNRLTFSLVKMLPSSFIQNQITAATDSVDAAESISDELSIE